MDELLEVVAAVRTGYGYHVRGSDVRAMAAAKWTGFMQYAQDSSNVVGWIRLSVDILGLYNLYMDTPQSAEQ